MPEEPGLTPVALREPRAKPTVGKIERIALREVWKHEAHDFTQWLEDNVDVLNGVLGLRLINVEREKAAGSFNVDLVAEDEQGRTVIIENQLEKSDHDHLGKVITYLTQMNAKAAIWIVSDPRPEHVGAITWLNSEVSTASFYLLKVEAVRIGDSQPAPLLTLIAGPNEESRVVGFAKKDMAESQRLRYRFWEQLLEQAKTKTKLHATCSPGWRRWLYVGAGGFEFGYAVREHIGEVGLWIDRGEVVENKKMFDELAASKAYVEQSFGGQLDWDRSDDRRGCWIGKACGTGGYREPEEKWPEIQDAMIDSMIRLERALKPFTEKLRLRE